MIFSIGEVLNESYESAMSPLRAYGNANDNHNNNWA